MPQKTLWTQSDLLDTPITKEEADRQCALCQELGSIKVLVWREVGQMVNSPLPDASPIRLHDRDELVHEKAVSKNAVSLCIRSACTSTPLVHSD